MGQVVLSARNVSKTFYGVTVLRGVHLEVLAGEVHGLLGQNGSGKSTLVKILAGYYAPDPGAALAVRGQPVPLPPSPDDLARLGLSFVHQDLALLEGGSVLENLYVRPLHRWRLRWAEERRRARQALARVGLDVDPDEPVAALAEVERALVAIARALEQLQGAEQGVLVLDEPTAYLPRDGVERLFAAIRRIRAAGFGVLFVSHRLDEVLAITDRVTILRDGVVVDVAPTRSLDEDGLIQRIVGSLVERESPRGQAPVGEPLLVADGVTTTHLRDVSLSVRRGEIVGVTGLMGMGHEQLPYALFGARPVIRGELWIEGRRYQLRKFTPQDAVAAGLGLLPANRLRDGGVGAFTVGENVTLLTLKRYVKRGLLRHRLEQEAAWQLLRQFSVQPPGPWRLFATLSGGNQQKALIGKWLSSKPKVMLLHEPTHGVDVGARRQILRQIRQMAEVGTGVLIASAEYDDLAEICSRVIVFRDGRAAAELLAPLHRAQIVEECLRTADATASGGSRARVNMDH